MSENQPGNATPGEGKPNVDITVSNVDVPRDQLRETLMKAIDEEIDRLESAGIVDVHLKSSQHIKA